jgi:hypothetical protein
MLVYRWDVAIRESVLETRQREWREERVEKWRIRSRSSSGRRVRGEGEGIVRYDVGREEETACMRLGAEGLRCLEKNYEVDG